MHRILTNACLAGEVIDEMEKKYLHRSQTAHDLIEIQPEDEDRLHSWDVQHTIVRSYPNPTSAEHHRAMIAALRLSFYWEFNDWEHEWENLTRLLAPPGPLTAVSFSVLPPTPLVPPPAIPSTSPPHAVFGKVSFTHWFLHGNLCFHEYEDGTRVGKPIDYRYP